MKRHFHWQPPNSPASTSQSNAKLRLLASDQIVSVTAHGFERCGSDHNIAAEAACLPRRYIPLRIAKPIIYCPFRKSLASAPTYRADIGMCPEIGNRLIGPILVQFTVSIDKLHICQIGCDLLQALKADVAGPRRREGNIQIEFDNFNSAFSRPFNRPVA